MLDNGKLNCDTILEAEFNYVAQTVFQNHEDRANTTTFYLAAIGSFVAAILSENSLNGGDYTYLAFTGLFCLLGLIGVRTLMELAQLRKAWFDSVLAMNSIKQYYINQYRNNLPFRQAFQWTLARRPNGHNKWSISSLLAYQTAMLSTGCFGTAAYFLVRYLINRFDIKMGDWLTFIFIALFMTMLVLLFCLQIRLYIDHLSKVQEKWIAVKDAQNQFLYLTTTGWKTGKQHQIEIWFVEREGRYYMVSEMRERSHWVQNVQRNPAISFRVGDTTYKGTGRVVDPATEPVLADAVVALMEAKYEWGDGVIVELTPESKL